MLQTKKRLHKSPERKRAIVLLGKNTNTRTLAYSSKFKKFAKKHNHVILRTKKLINTYFEALRRGNEVKSKEGDISIVRYASGTHKGAANLITLRAKVGERLFFIKIIQGKDTRLAQRYDLAEILLQKLGRKINGFTVRIIRPQLIYSEGVENRSLSKPGRTFFVSDFIDQKKVVQPYTYFGKERDKIYETLGEVSDFMKQEGVILDSPHLNSFYEQKTKTIYLYDI